MKRAGYVLLCVLLILALPLGVLAADGGDFLRSHYEVRDNVLQCFGLPLPEGGKLTVSVGTQTDVDAALSTVARENLPTTVYCLVDTSSCTTNYQMTQTRNVLHGLSEKLGAQDNMVIATIGGELSQGPVLSTDAERSAAIDAIKPYSGPTDLFQAIVETLDTLERSTGFHDNRFLLILSDGLDNENTSTTEDMVVERIRKSYVSVYGVSVVDYITGDTNVYYINLHAKKLQRFADGSVGGLYFSPELNKDKAEDIAQSIWDNVQQSCVVQVDLTGVKREAGKETMLLVARYETGDTRYEDTLTVYTQDIPEATVNPTVPAESENPSAADVVEEPQPGKKELPKWVLPVAIAGGILLIGLVVLIIVLATRKKAPAPVDQEYTGWDDGPNLEVEGDVPITGPIWNDPPTLEAETVDFPAFGSIPQTRPVSDKPQETSPNDPGCHVELTVVGDVKREISFFLPENKAMGLGRNEKSQIIVDPNDRKLSGRNSEMYWDGKQLFVKDAGSMNKTFVNGVELVPGVMVLLEDDALLRMGAFTYRVRLTPGVRG